MSEHPASATLIHHHGPLLHLVLVAPQIPPNAGTLARTALALRGRLHLIRPLGFRVDEASLRRAGLDYLEQASMVVHDSYAAFATSEPQAAAQAWFYSTRGTRLHWTATHAPGDALVFGSETHGLPPEMFDWIPPERLLKLAQPGDAVRSLNLACCATAAAYEALRQMMAGPVPM